MADEDGETDAAQAFEGLRAEVTLVRRAVERLTAERTELPDTPDYSETLGVISQNLTATAQRVDALVKSPALALTPEELNRQIVAAGYTARKEDHRLFAAGRQGLEEAVAKVGRQLQSHLVAGEQRRRLWQAGLAGLVLGMMVWAVLPGLVARTVPPRWLWPEQMAARTLRMSMWEGGQRLMRAGDAEAYAGMAVGARLVIANRDALAACRSQAAKAKKAVRCTIHIEAEE